MALMGLLDEMKAALQVKDEQYKKLSRMVEKERRAPMEIIVLWTHLTFAAPCLCVCCLFLIFPEISCLTTGSEGNVRAVNRSVCQTELSESVSRSAVRAESKVMTHPWEFNLDSGHPLLRCTHGHPHTDIHNQVHR